MKKLCTTIALVLSLSAFAGPVKTWPAVEVRTCAPLSVKVNGAPVDVMTLPGPTHCLKNDDAKPYFATFFEADEEVEVEVAGDVPMNGVRVLPLSRGVKPQIVNAKTMRFRTKPPFTLAVEPTGRHNALIVCANVPETSVPDPKDPNVVYFGPGRHHRDEAIWLKSNQTLYLAPGSYVEGAVCANGTNITVCGRGILSGATWQWGHHPKGCGHLMQLRGSDITVRDVTLMSSFGWCLVLNECERAAIDNVKILNGRVLNDDGIDVCSSRSVTIRNCFIRAQDDCITPKWWCEDLLVENCALWTDVANIFRIGYECKGKDFRYRNLTFRDIDILHQSIHKKPSCEYWAENTIFIQPANDQLFENFTFERLRFDTVEAGDLFLTLRTFKVNDPWQHHKVAGHFRGLVIRDVQFPKDLPPNTMGVRLESHDPTHGVADVAFENVRGCGPLIVAGDVKDVKIPPSSFVSRTPVTAWPTFQGSRSLRDGTSSPYIVKGNSITFIGPATSIASAIPVSKGVFTARLTAKTPPTDPAQGTTFGLRVKGPNGYWGLSFWRQPGAAGREGPRRFEFEEMRDGKRFAQRNLVNLYSRGTDRSWDFGQTCIFSIRLHETGVEATVFDDRGNELFAEAWAFNGQPAVKEGRPTFYTWGGTAGTVEDVSIGL